MCGIVGYIGKHNNPQIGIEALKRLEYRGYDSAGAAWFLPGKKEIFCLKTAGRIDSLEKKIRDINFPLKGNPSIYHTRWATHGEPNEINAHPHSDCRKNIYLVHNGIIENYKFLKERLQKESHQFSSETDTEILAHLIEKFFQGNLEEATRKALALVKGTYGLVVIAADDPEKIVVARNSSPLLIGLGDQEYIVASDPAAIIGRTKKVVYLDDGEVAVLSPNNFSITDLNQIPKEKLVEEIEWDIEEAQKGGFSHFMMKEIFETPEVIENAIRGRLIEKEGLAKLGGLEKIEERLRNIENLIIIACGTSYFAGLVGEYMIEEYAKTPVQVEYGSEFRYRNPILGAKTAVLAISQS